MLQLWKVSGAHPSLEMLNELLSVKSDSLSWGLGDRLGLTGSQGSSILSTMVSATPPPTTMSALLRMRPHSVCCGCLQPASHGPRAAPLGLGRGEGRQADKVMTGISAQDRMLPERVTFGKVEEVRDR